jgi:hypothetical protein
MEDATAVEFWTADETIVELTTAEDEATAELSIAEDEATTLETTADDSPQDSPYAHEDEAAGVSEVAALVEVEASGVRVLLSTAEETTTAEEGTPGV